MVPQIPDALTKRRLSQAIADAHPSCEKISDDSVVIAHQVTVKASRTKRRVTGGFFYFNDAATRVERVGNERVSPMMNRNFILPFTPQDSATGFESLAGISPVDLFPDTALAQ
ncbi:MAG TPA: hypothetical protein VFE46_05525 [Pirellulales bacterium]|nr:hypothetical protein [Pirellulales bacterium]